MFLKNFDLNEGGGKLRIWENTLIMFFINSNGQRPLLVNAEKKMKRGNLQFDDRRLLSTI